MGRNKAFLTVDGRTLLEIAINAVRHAGSEATIVGSRELYGHLQVPVIQDLRSNAGPLAGIEAALADTRADWNLIVACDMPGLSPEPLIRILDEALSHPAAGCVLPESGPGTAEPLCAAYHKRMLPVISAALDAGVRKVTDAFPPGSTRLLPMGHHPLFQNVNTPEEWRRFEDVAPGALKT